MSKKTDKDDKRKYRAPQLILLLVVVIVFFK